MAHLFLREILLSFGAWIAYSKLRTWLDDRRLKKWGEENGCGDTPTVPNKLPWGLERLWVLLTGMKGAFLCFS